MGFITFVSDCGKTTLYNMPAISAALVAALTTTTHFSLSNDHVHMAFTADARLAELSTPGGRNLLIDGRATTRALEITSPPGHAYITVDSMLAALAAKKLRCSVRPCSHKGPGANPRARAPAARAAPGT